MTGEQEHAYNIGVARSKANANRGSRDRYRWKPTIEEKQHVDGMSAVAEMEVARFLGRKWLSQQTNRKDNPEDGDVDGGVSVRWSSYRMASLIVHEDEPDGLVCVLVTGKEPDSLKINGWIPSEKAKNMRWWRTDVRHPAFFVPQKELMPIHSLSSNKMQTSSPYNHLYFCLKGNGSLRDRGWILTDDGYVMILDPAHKPTPQVEVKEVSNGIVPVQ